MLHSKLHNSVLNTLYLECIFVRSAFTLRSMPQCSVLVAQNGSKIECGLVKTHLTNAKIEMVTWNNDLVTVNVQV